MTLPTFTFDDPKVIILEEMLNYLEERDGFPGVTLGMYELMCELIHRMFDESIVQLFRELVVTDTEFYVIPNHEFTSPVLNLLLATDNADD